MIQGIFRSRFMYSSALIELRRLFSFSETDLDFMKINSISKVEGDYYEFGVHAGISTRAVYHLIVKKHPKMRMHSFDSFREPIIDKSIFFDYMEGVPAIGKPELISILSRNGVDLARLSIHEGDFSESITKETLQNPAKIVLVDCDPYYSTRDVLNHIACILQHHTIIIFGGWNLSDQDNGQKLAVREWLKVHKDIRLHQIGTFRTFGSFFMVCKVGVDG